VRAGTDTGTTAARGMSAPALHPATADDRAAARPMRVLFLCTGNSCRSILAEATFNHLAPPHWRALSAGSRPTGQVHPRSLALLRRAGIPTDGYHSKSWDALPEAPDLLITVCASAAGEACPAYLGPAVRAHWGVDDPPRDRHGRRIDAALQARTARWGASKRSSRCRWIAPRLHGCRRPSTDRRTIEVGAHVRPCKSPPGAP
jgi:arsenate reductase